MAADRLLLVGGSTLKRTGLIESVVRPAGYFVVEVADLEEASKQLAAINPHLILLDLGIDLRRVLAFVAANEAMYPILVILPEGPPELIQATLYAGARDVLFEPFDTDRFAAAVARGQRLSHLMRERDYFREQVHQQAQEFNVLYTLSKRIASLFDVDAILSMVVTAAVNLTRADQGMLMLLDDASGELYLRASRNIAEATARTLRLKVNDTLMGRVIQSRRPVIMTSADLVKVKTSFLVKSILGVPLIVGERVTGVLSVDNTLSNSTFSEHHVHVLWAMADSAAIAIENARLYGTEKQRVMELMRTLEQQRELDRLKNEFVQNISHELRTPLAIVRGYAELLDNDEPSGLSPEARESISVIARRSRMLGKLLDDLLSILSAETGKMAREPIDLAKLIESLIAEFQPAAKQTGVTLSAQIEPSMNVVSGDPVQLRRVLDNLLSNAAKFTSAGGTITVRLAARDGCVALEVSDTGIGIPADQLPRIFERFYQVDGSTTRRYGGVGLGLSLVKEIVEGHGGRVSVESEVGSGTTFRVILPTLVDTVQAGLALPV